MALLSPNRYTVCIRPEMGMCCIEYQVCANEPRAYSLSSGGVVDGAANVAVLDSKCSGDYTEIIGDDCSSELKYWLRRKERDN